MKIHLSEEGIFAGGYDMDNGPGAAQKVIDTLRASNDVNNPVIAGTHKIHAKTEAMHARAQLGEETTFKDGPNPSVRLGLGRLADELEPRIDKVLKD